MIRFAERFTKPTQTVFLLLALGFVLSSARHTVANYLWRAVICQAVGQVPESEPIRVRIDGTVCRKSGEEIEPTSTYRNGAGAARQEYRM